MRTETRKLYTAAELKKYRGLRPFAGAFEKAYKTYLEGQSENGLEFEMDDAMASIKGLFDACSGISLKNWDIGIYNRNNHLKVEFTGGQRYGGGDDVEKLSGPRAIAWLENNLLCGIRVQYVPLLTVKLEMEKQSAYYEKVRGLSRKERDNVPKNYSEAAIKRHYYKPGTIAECPFTGVCYDMDLLDALIKNVRDGMDLKSAFEDLADVAAKLLESAEDYQRTEEYFLDTAAANDYEYDKDGDRV